MTEQEAKTSRCCGSGEQGEMHEDGKPDYYRYCIGSACMAWRWSGILKNGRPIRNEVAAQHAEFGDYDPKIETALGHCGLAGKP